MANTKKRWKPTDDQMLQVERMAGIGLTMAQIANVLGVSYETFLAAQKKDDSIRCRVLKAIDTGNGAVHNTLFKMATSGTNPAATIFWMKVRSRWKEPPAELQHIGKDGKPADPNEGVKVIVQLPSKDS